mmetsp:Transcript_22807/g.53271  ORF Transcript_22807/g.53271 Transcript_22807/m.53271 type:complete len:514 (+) Transcript_22807:128-1669(+)
MAEQGEAHEHVVMPQAEGEEDGGWIAAVKKPRSAAARQAAAAQAAAAQAAAATAAPLKDSQPVVPVTLADVGLNTERKVVIDAGAAIKLQRLERFGGSLFTTSAVMSEIKDEKARALLETLPQDIATMEPAAEEIAYCKQFAKATGDLGTLSHNDMDLIALTVTLHRRAGGPALRTRPAALGEADAETAADFSGFEWAPRKVGDSECGSTAGSRVASETFKLVNPSQRVADSGSTNPDVIEEEQAEEENDTSQTRSQNAQPHAADTQVNEADCDVAPSENAEGNDDEEDDEEDSDSEDSSGAGEWVTPDNIQHFGIAVEPAADMKVTCVTSDYAVQNVLLQMGITPITFDGYAVRTVKLWGLVCRACFFFTRDTQKVFCPKCGHDTVVRVPIVVDADGQPRVLHHGRRLRRKGTIYSVPKPQGGRGWKPIFAEDEVKIGSRDRELRHHQRLYNKERKMKDPFNEDNAARGWWQRSTTSTGRMLDCHSAPKVQAGYGRRNPNASNFKFPGKKKR